MGRGKSKPETADHRGGGYFLLPRCLLTSAAWLAASPRAVKLTLALCARHKGWNNGKIKLSVREAADAIGSRNFKAILGAFYEIELLGLVALEKDYPRGQRLAREYRLTFVRVGDRPATNDYLAWSPGDAGTCNKRVSPTETETTNPVTVTEAEANLSVAATETDCPEKADFSNVAVTNGSAHIDNHRGRSSGSRFNRPLMANDLSGGGSVVSAAPSTDELRERVAAHLERYGRGVQSRLADEAGIPRGTFSKFLNHSGPLAGPARIRLTLAMPRSEKHERLSESAAA